MDGGEKAGARGFPVLARSFGGGEMSKIARLFTGRDWLTVTGQDGTGKSRPALFPKLP